VYFTVVVPRFNVVWTRKTPRIYPEGRLWGFKSPVESSIVISIVYAQKYCPSSAPVFMKFKNFVQENVKIALYFHILLQFIGFALDPVAYLGFQKRGGSKRFPPLSLYFPSLLLPSPSLP